jgi:hypothetical protein
MALRSWQSSPFSKKNALVSRILTCVAVALGPNVIEINSQIKELETAHVPKEVRHGLLRLHRICYPPLKKEWCNKILLCVFLLR